MFGIVIYARKGRFSLQRTLRSEFTILANANDLAMIVNYDCNHSFIVLPTVITIVNYDHKTFIVQATGRTEKMVRMLPLYLQIMASGGGIIDRALDYRIQEFAG